MRTNSTISYILGWVLKILAVFFLIPVLVSLIYREKDGVYFVLCSGLCAIVGRLCAKKKPDPGRFYARSGFVATALCWILLSAVGALPFYLSGQIPNYIDALFETTSGFSTTGSTILTDVESLSHCMLFWRSFTHWIGGMGILVFVLTILPSAGGQALYLMRAECTGPQTGKLYPKIQKTALTLYIIYTTMTVLEIVLLLIGGMEPFDAFCISFGTAGTGGFGVRNTSCGGYSAYSQVVITIFMILFGINFNFYFFLITKRVKEALAMEEVRWYFIIYTAVTASVFVSIVSTAGNVAGLFRAAAFQTASIMTSTGYATVDYETWPHFCQAVFMVLMFIGACAGSTGGGMKVSRFIIWFKTVKKEIGQFIHPQCVQVIKMDGKPVPHETLRMTNVYGCAFVLVFAISFLIVSLDQFSFDTTFSAITTLMNNIGPGLGMVGPSGNFSEFSWLSKIVFVFDMLAGRLEVFAMLMLFSPSAWKH